MDAEEFSFRTWFQPKEEPIQGILHCKFQQDSLSNECTPKERQSFASVLTGKEGKQLRETESVLSASFEIVK